MQRILLIEDEESIRVGFGAILRLKGFEVIEAAEGWEGVRLARKNLPDLIICDVPDYRQLFYHFGVSHVSHVIKRGRVVYAA